MTELAGTLRSIGLAPLLGFLTGLRKTGSLVIFDGPFGGRVFLEGGRVVGAVFGAERGQTAFEAIVLVLGGGEFTFDEDAAERELNFMVDPDRLDEHLRRLSAERARFAGVLPSLAVVPSVSLTALDEQEVTLNAGALRLLLEVDGSRTLLELARERGLVAAAMGVSRLVELGLLTVRPVEAEASQAGSTSAPTPQRTPASTGRYWPARTGTVSAPATREPDNRIDPLTRRGFDGRGPGGG
jgi:hypothetical protein